MDEYMNRGENVWMDRLWIDDCILRWMNGWLIEDYVDG